LAVIISVAVFAVAHLRGWGPSHLLATAASGAIFALLYISRRDLPSNILAHFLTDATAFLTR
jgi:membrane protease YdiL (CAAX protease family)